MKMYWGRHKVLPATLAVSNNEQGSYLIRKDPESGLPYEYRIIDAKNYELCAIFKSKTVSDQGSPSNNFWAHGVGRHCFILNVENSRR